MLNENDIDYLILADSRTNACGEHRLKIELREGDVTVQ